LRKRLPQRRHHDRIEVRGDLLELDVDDVRGADGARFRLGPDESEPQHLASGHAKGVVPVAGCHGSDGRPDDADLHAGH